MSLFSFSIILNEGSAFRRVTGLPLECHLLGDWGPVVWSVVNMHYKRQWLLCPEDFIAYAAKQRLGEGKHSAQKEKQKMKTEAFFPSYKKISQSFSYYRRIQEDCPSANVSRYPASSMWWTSDMQCLERYISTMASGHWNAEAFHCTEPDCGALGAPGKNVTR